jgi:hypothetical protein
VKRYAKKLLAVMMLAGSVMLPVGLLLAEEFTSADFKVLNPVITIGGGYSQSGSFQLQGSVGQPAPGRSLSPNFGVNAGFLFFPAPLAPGVPLPSPPITQLGGGFIRPYPIPTPRPIIICVLSDFNCDGRINLKDVSIFLFWMNRREPEAQRYDLNGDGRLDIRDISIILYYWTG